MAEDDEIAADYGRRVTGVACEGIVNNDGAFTVSDTVGTERFYGRADAIYGEFSPYGGTFCRATIGKMS